MTENPTAPSTIAHDPQSLNRYSYVRNNPLLFIDPIGQHEEDAGICDDDPSIVCTVSSADAEGSNGNSYSCGPGCIGVEVNGSGDDSGGFNPCDLGLCGGPGGPGNSSVGNGGGNAANNSKNNAPPKPSNQPPVDCVAEANTAAAQVPSPIPDKRSLLAGAISAIVTYLLPPEYGGGSPAGAGAGFAIGTGIQSLQNAGEGGLRFQAALQACNASQGIVVPMGN